MKLVSCYITGFGQMKDFSYDFNGGLDTICQENGWGKTTFSVFLKAMFYGMEYSRSRDLTERKHYLPWDGSQCGGNLVFSVGEKEYRIERTFGKKDKDDTFRLIDVLTGKESEDYSENVGEELFEVDRDSFEKSIFIPQSAVSTTMTDSLNAKMGDMASAKDDINNFDAAVNRVAEARKNYTRRSAVNNGKLNILKDEISKCSELIDTKGAVADGYTKQSEMLEEKKKKLNWLEAEKNRVAELIRQQSKKEQDMGAFRQKKEFLSEKMEELTKLDDFFASGVPTGEEQEAMEDLERQHDVSTRAEMELAVKIPPEQQINKWEKLFSEKVPSQQDLEDWKALSVKMQELQLQGKHARLSEESQKQLEELNHFFSKKLPSEEELSQVEKDAIEISRLEGRIVEQDENYRNVKAKREMASKHEKEGGKYSSVLLLVFLSAAFIAGAFAFHIVTPGSGITFQIICFIGAVATAVAAVMQSIRIRSASKNKQDELEQQLLDASVALEQCKAQKQELTDRTREFLSDFMLTPSDSFQQMTYEIRVNLDHYHRLKEEEEQATENTTGTVEEYADVRMELYTLLSHFAEVYEMDLYHESCESLLLEKLKKDMVAYEEYSLNKKQKELLEITRKKQEELLVRYVGRFPLEEGLSYAEALRKIHVNAENYLRLHEDIEKMQDELKQFADVNNVDEELVPVEELQERQESIDEEIKELHRGITQDRETIITLGDELDAIEEAENRREELLEKKQEAENNVELLAKTEEFLQMAKEQFLSRYMAPLRRGMGHYLTLLDEKYRGDAEGMDFDITMDLAVQVIRNGATHSSDYLSHGYQDLVGLCARFALVDVLYHKEKPMIVLDDPFTNLDEEKTERALKLLTDIAKERQIIYFTCHESRMPKKS